jgi:hypothetical protein
MRVAIVAFAVALSGCGIAAKVDARNDMEQSKAAYKNCLAANPSNPSACAGLEAAFQADLAAYRATSAGVNPNTVEINQN